MPTLTLARSLDLDTLIDDNMANWSAGEFFSVALTRPQSQDGTSSSNNNPMDCY